MPLPRISAPETRILVVDDDAITRMLACAALEHAGLLTIQAEDGQEALDKFAAERPDLVVLDVNMPRLNGFEVCSRLRSDTHGANAPILMMTALNDSESIQQAYEVGATDFVTKPVIWTIFVERIRYMIRASRAFGRIEEARRVAEEASRAKLDFLANVSHEIRTPLTAILGYLELLFAEDPLSSDEEHTALDAIRSNALQLQRLIDDILEHSRVESGQQPLHLAACCVLQTATQVLESLRPAALAKDLGLAIRVDGQPVTRIRTDSLRVGQILMKLLSNAIKFTHSGEIELAVRESRDASGVELAVSDTGIGLTREEIERVFEPFTQANASTVRSFGGTGLGLTIVKRLVETLGGSLSVTSQPGAGSTFRVALPSLPPCEHANEERAAQQAVPSSGTVKPPMLKGQCNLLLVEDSPDTQRLLRWMLEKAGARVSVAPHGRAAVEAALAAVEREPFDLILMDMQMPVCDGYEATRELRERGYRGPVVALTAHATEEDRERCVAAGCNDYLTKPIDRAGLIEAVQHWCCGEGSKQVTQGRRVGPPEG
jgi:signal transduction histidine kinase